MSSRRDSRLSTSLPLNQGWRLFLGCLPAVFLALWAANFVDAVPAALAGGSLLTGGINRRGILITIVAWCVESLLYGYAIVRLDARARGVSLVAGQAWRIAMRAAPAILLGDIVYNIAAWGGLLVFIVPGVIFATTLAFFAFAAVVDHKNVFDALAYSHALTWPDWWRTSVVLSVPAIVLFVYSVIMGWPVIMDTVHALAAGQMSIASVSNPWYDLGLMPLLGAVVWAYVLSVLYVQYGALKARAAVH